MAIAVVVMSYGMRMGVMKHVLSFAAALASMKNSVAARLRKRLKH